MIPIVSFSNLVIVPFVIFIAFRLYFSFQKTKNKNVGYFFGAFLSFSIMEVLLSTPGLLLKDLIKIDTVFAIYPFFILLGLTSLAAIPFSVLKWGMAEKVFLISMIIFALFITVLNILNIRDAVVSQNPPFIYFEDTRGADMNILIGIVIVLFLLFFISFFSFKGLKITEKYERIRSFLLAGGAAMFLFAVVFNYVLGSVNLEYKNIASLISTFFAIASSLIIFTGVNYKAAETSKQEPEVETKEDVPKIQW